MSAPLSVNATVGDISIEFKDSCNCCGFSKTIAPPNTPIYINSDGQAEKFKFDASYDYVVSLERTYDNLQAYIESLDTRYLRPSTKIRRHLRKRDIVDLKATPREPLTLQQVEKINTALREIVLYGGESTSEYSNSSTQSAPF